MEQEQKLNPITIKSFTDIEQSRKLEEILPIESADMVYIKHSSSYNPTWEFNEDFPPMILGNVPINKMTVEVLPCWSLAALFSFIREIIGYEVLCLDRKTITIKCELGDKPWNIEVNKSNEINACVAMIIKLHELNLL